MYDYKDICRAVCVIARQTGEYISRERENFTQEKIEQKGRHNLVSYVDKNAEKQIVEKLGRLLPEAGFIAEEGSATHNGEELCWVIDPLDGTTNFMHGLPPYCVSIALMQREEVVVGVVYEATLKELFYAWQGSEAFMNDRPIRASKVERMENSLIAVGFSYDESARSRQWLDRIAHYQANSDGVRRLGSSTADAVYVACGRFDAFVQSGLSAWDVAAASLIAQRAGACVSDFAGGDDYIFGRQFVATNPLIYKEIIDTLND